MFVITMKSISKKICIVLSVVITSITSQTAFSADNYQVTDLGKFGGINAESFAINEEGLMVGFSTGTDFSSHAFVYQNDTLVDLGFLINDLLPGGVSVALGVNNNNIATGFSTQALDSGEVDADGEVIFNNINVGTYFDIANLTVNALPQVDPDINRETRGISINDNNIIVGFASIDPPDDVDSNGDPISSLFDRGFFYDIASDQMTIVGSLDDNDAATVVLRAINNDNFAVGVSTQLVNEINSTQVFSVDLSAPNELTRLDIFGGAIQQAWDVNAAKKVVGSARTETNQNVQAYLYDVQTAAATALGYLNDNFGFSQAFGINDSDQIVGTSQIQNSPSTFHAFIYENGSMKDLSNMIGCDTGWILQEARAINNTGVITGNGIFEGERRAFSLTPLAGTAPDCELLNSSGGGSVPVSGLFSLFLLSFFRKRR